LISRIYAAGNAQTILNTILHVLFYTGGATGAAGPPTAVGRAAAGYGESTGVTLSADLGATFSTPPENTKNK